MNIKLLKLKLRNFKGIKEFELDTQGRNVNIYGDNATGKTTLFDAFTWLLFDKDSLNRKDFEIKTLDKNGQPLHGLEHEVEAILDVNGKQLTLKKVFKEKWTKKRGSAMAEFTGHTTDYFIDGVPVKKSEYDAKISEIANEDVFKLLTNPLYFNEHLSWQERRKLLLEVCGDISDEEVIASNKALSKLPEILQGRKLEDYRKIITIKKSEINKELEKIPIRIDEVERGLPGIENINQKALKEKLSILKQELQQKQKELIQAESGGIIADKTKELRELEAEILKQETEFKREIDNNIVDKQRLLMDLQIKASELNLRTIVQEIDTTALEKELEQLRQQWHEINSQEFSSPDICPVCGQLLPTEKIEEARAKFNREKAQKLEQITKQGKEKRAQLEKIKAEYQERIKQADKAKEELERINREINKIKREIEQLRELKVIADNSLLQKKQALEEEIRTLKAGNAETVEKIKQEIKAIEEEITNTEKELAKIEQHKQGLKRIEELKQQERQLAAEYEKLEEELYLTEQFIRTKVNLLEERINSKFKLARFKLFDVQINGAVIETCETLYDGVPYSNLNHGAQINIGLDIINTLSEYYGFEAPIFIDNAEAVTQLLETRGQQIRLIVSEKDKKLRVEVM